MSGVGGGLNCLLGHLELVHPYQKNNTKKYAFLCF